MTANDREITWERYDRDENDFPEAHRGYSDEADHPDDNECGGVLGADGHIYSDADPGL